MPVEPPQHSSQTRNFRQTLPAPPASLAQPAQPERSILTQEFASISTRSPSAPSTTETLHRDPGIFDSNSTCATLGTSAPRTTGTLHPDLGFRVNFHPFHPRHPSRRSAPSRPRNLRETPPALPERSILTPNFRQTPPAPPLKPAPPEPAQRPILKPDFASTSPRATHAPTPPALPQHSSQSLGKCAIFRTGICVKFRPRHPHHQIFRRKIAPPEKSSEKIFRPLTAPDAESRSPGIGP